MNLFTARELIESYSKAGAAKTELPVLKMLILGLLAGIFIAFGALASNTASFSITNVGLARMISGLIFAFGLGIVILLGTELFTGNCLIIISVLDRQAKLPGMLKNLFFVYLGNFIGGVLIAYFCSVSGQFNYSDNALAVYTIRIASDKCDISFMAALIKGILCNILVSVGVLQSLTAKDTIGRIIGAFSPVFLFVICGFEHSIANMFYVPSGLFSLNVPEYADSVMAANLNISSLTWGNFITNNLLPVTVGNIIGGITVGILMWMCFTVKSTR